MVGGEKQQQPTKKILKCDVLCKIVKIDETNSTGDEHIENNCITA